MMRNRIVAALTAAALANFASAVHAAAYASDVKIAGTTVTFTLNEPANALTYSLNGGPAVALDGTAKGTKTFTLGSPTDTFSISADKTASSGYTIPAGTTINGATGGLSRPAPGAGLNVISDDTSVLNRFNSPRGIAVSNNPNAPNFGTVYIGNSANGTLAVSGVLPARTLTSNQIPAVGGIYALRSDGSDAFGYGDEAKNPTNLTDPFPLFIASTSSPYRLSVDAAGTVYAADWADANSNAFVISPDLQTGANLFTGYLGTSGSANPDGTSLPAGQYHGSMPAVYPEGTTTFTKDGGGVYNGFQTNSLVLYTLDEDMNSAHVSGVTTDPQNDRNSIWKHDIGSVTAPVNVVPTKVFGGPTGLIGDVATGGITADFTRGPDGKFYTSQYRAAGLQPGLVVTDANGVKLWDSLTATKALTVKEVASGTAANNPADYNRDAGVNAADYVMWRNNTGTTAPVPNEVDLLPAAGQWNDADYTAWRTRFGVQNDILTALFQIEVSPDGKWLAGNLNGSDVVLIPLLSGIPDLAGIQVIDSATPNVNSARDIAFDAAGNIHYVSSGQGQYRVLAPGGHTLATTSWNGSAFTFALTNPPGSGSLAGGVVPEPTTIGLSLLSLFALCSFRKRHA